MGIQILRTKHKIETKEACQDIKMTNELSNFDMITGKSGSFDDMPGTMGSKKVRERKSGDNNEEEDNSEDDEDRKTRESIMV